MGAAAVTPGNTYEVHYSTGVKRLQGTRPDTIRFHCVVGHVDRVLMVTNLDRRQVLSFTTNGTIPQQGAEDTFCVEPSARLRVAPAPVVMVAGRGNEYIAQVLM